jgi:hypothetical protein
LANGQTINGTRAPLGPNYGNDDCDATVGNSNYNSLQVALRHAEKRYNFSVNYTLGKSIDQASSISDTGNPFNLSSARALSAFDLRHNFVASYTVNLPFDRLSSHWRSVVGGWQLSGITRITYGFPVTLHEDGDNSLQGGSPNGVNNHYLDTPDYSGLPLDINSNPRNGHAYFNIAAFAQNALGEPELLRGVRSMSRARSTSISPCCVTLKSGRHSSSSFASRRSTPLTMRSSSVPPRCRGRF